MGEVVAFTSRETTNVEHAYHCIQHAITTRRDAFVTGYQSGKYGSTFQTYEDELDREVYKELGKFRSSNQEALQRAKDELDSYTRFQLETSIGERLNVGLSTYGFRLEKGQLASEKTGEPIVVMIERGRQARNAQVVQQIAKGKISSEVGEQIMHRHDAEVEQFRKIQAFMSSPHTLPGATMISISPPGPGYAHNFYDVFTLQKAADGARYVEAKRYASSLTPEKSLFQAQAIASGYGKDMRDTALIPYFLANPIVVDDPTHMLFNNPEGIHSFMQADPNAMKEADFILVKDIISGIISVYLHEIFEYPEDVDRHAEILDALKNKADEAANTIKVLREHATSRVLRRDSPLVDRKNKGQQIQAALADINRLGSQPVRVTTTGCGESGSSRKKRGGLQFGNSLEANMPGNMSPLSLLDAILDNSESDGFECPNCHIGRVKGDQCPHCNITSKQWAEKHPELACA